jgi:hypothetical protein
MEEDAVSSESFDVEVDGGWGGLEDAGDLAVGGSRDGVFLDLR